MVQEETNREQAPEESFKQKLVTLQRTIESALHMAHRVPTGDANEALQALVSVEFALEQATEYASDLDEMIRRKIAQGVL